MIQSPSIPLQESPLLESGYGASSQNATTSAASATDTFASAETATGSTSPVSPALSLPRPGLSVSSAPVILKDAEIHSLFKEAGVDLTALWDPLLDALTRQNLDTLIVEAADTNFEAPGSCGLPEDVASLLGGELASIQASIAGAHALSPTLKEGVSRYFTLDSYRARLNGGDEYLLSVPATPVKLLAGPGGVESCQTFEKISQSSAAFEVLNPSEDINADPEVEVSYPRLKKWFINYLKVSGKAFSLWDAITAHPYPPAGNLAGAPAAGASGQKDTAVRGEDTLKEIDNRHFMRPERDQQGHHGYCWSFASTRLAEEQVCKKEPDSLDCKAPLSPLDTTYDTWRFAERQEGGYISEGLQNTLDHGVCRNERAFYPNDPQEHQIVDHINDYFKALRDSDEAVDEADWKNFTLLSYDLPTRSFGNHPITLDNELLEAVRTVHHQSQSWWRVWQWPLRFSFADNPLGSTLSATMSTLSWGTSDTSRALRDTLVGSECTGNRVKAPFEDLSHAEATFRFSAGRPERLAALKEAIEHGNSVGVGMCVGNQIKRPGCFPHAIVMDALRYDRPNDKWEGHFINSWGEGSTVMNSWKDLGDVVDDFLAINYFVPKTNEA